MTYKISNKLLALASVAITFVYFTAAIPILTGQSIAAIASPVLA